MAIVQVAVGVLVTSIASTPFLRLVLIAGGVAIRLGFDVLNGVFVIGNLRVVLGVLALLSLRNYFYEVFLTANLRVTYCPSSFLSKDPQNLAGAAGRRVG